jgi:hypothetical protein
MRSTVIVVALALALAACKAKREPASKASCHFVASASCEEYASDGKAYLERRSQDCKQISGTWSTAACPTADLLGSCRETTAGWTRTRHYYAGAPVDLARTQVECGAFGTWLEPAKPQ